MTDLLERDNELRALTELVERAVRGEGVLAVVSGPAGIGKTSLLEWTRRMATERGLQVLQASGTELETGYPFVIARELFERTLAQMHSDARELVLAGPAALATAVLSVDGRSGETPGGADPLSSALHGLYWLTANLAAAEPLLLLVDDVQWADPASLRFLSYLARRLDGVSAALVLSLRAGERGDQGALPTLVSERSALRLDLAPLSNRAVASLVQSQLGRAPEPEFVDACVTATGGVPFLLLELLDVLAADGVTPGADAAASVKTVAPATVAHTILLRIAGLGGGAVALANAMAVLGGHTRLDLAARLAELDQQRAAAAADDLVARHVLRVNGSLDYVHPIVRQAVYDDMGPVARSTMHRRAAELLSSEGATKDAISAHLLAAAPAGDDRTVADLREAAARALERGAPESAVRYLNRALAEGGAGDDRAELLHELARAETVLRDPAAVSHLRDALTASRDPHRRALIAYDLGELLSWIGQWDAAGELFARGLEDAAGEPDLSLKLRAIWAARSAYSASGVAEFDSRLPELRAAASEERPGAAPLGLLLAAVSAFRGEPAAEVIEQLARAGAGPEVVKGLGVEHFALGQLIGSQVMYDELKAATLVIDELVHEARRAGSVLGYVAGIGLRGYVRTRRGELSAAEADVRAAAELAGEYELQFPLVALLHYALDALLERPGLGDVAAVAWQAELPPGLIESAPGAMLEEVRGRLALVDGEIDKASVHLGRCGELFTSLRISNPAFTAWRSTLARALVGRDPERARALVQDELREAERVGLPRGVGQALRAAGTLEPGEDGISLLRRSVQTLAVTDARLEHARSLVELGAALRRSARRSEAREPLRLGLDLAERCGAERLVAHARTELSATGARPRRHLVAGRDALTPSEARIAQMAADGLTNRDIAQSLFVTAKTVENTLSRAYRKLGIEGRESLVASLERRH